MRSPEDIRARFRFDAERLRALALRIESADRALVELRRALEVRAIGLRDLGASGPERMMGLAKAQAVGTLARKASLREVLGHGHALGLIAAMATSRWVGALRSLGAAPRGSAAVRGHIETGRIACRILATLRRERVTGAGQLASAVVVAEVAHASDRPAIDDQIAEALFRASRAGVAESELLEATSSTLRRAAELLEAIALEVEPAIARLRTEAEVLERKVELSYAVNKPRR